MLYYFYKKKGRKYYIIIKDLKNKVTKYQIRIIIKLLLFQFDEVVKLYARLFAFYKFKKKYLK